MEVTIAGNGCYALARTTKQHSSEFVIRHEKLDLHLCLSPLDKLHLHEETIPDRVSELKRELLRDEMVKDPIVIDIESYVVLDGMHRVAALRELNCTSIPVCAVEYQNPSIRVCAWYRAMSGRPSRDEIKAALLTSGLEFVAFSFDKTSIIENPTLAILFVDGECLKLKSKDLEVFDTLRLAEQCARQLGLSVRFETERDALENLVNRKTEAVMMLPKIDKASVREAGLTGRLLPHKVTRHIIPARPLKVDIPLKTLTEEATPLQETNARFVSSLQARGMTREPAGSIVGGRRYEEETFIFN